MIFLQWSIPTLGHRSPPVPIQGFKENVYAQYICMARWPIMHRKPQGTHITCAHNRTPFQTSHAMACRQPLTVWLRVTPAAGLLRRCWVLSWLKGASCTLAWMPRLVVTFGALVTRRHSYPFECTRECALTKTSNENGLAHKCLPLPGIGDCPISAGEFPHFSAAGGLRRNLKVMINWYTIHVIYVHCITL